jgi:glyoxylase-like metal-dependent hydrolase (beta-lactamase superfamily II)
MSEILPGVHVVDGVTAPGAPGAPGAHVNVCLLVDGRSITMVDAGYRSSERHAVLDYLERIGAGPTDVRRVIITHHHPDHTGGLATVVAHTGAEVWAHVEDAPYIDGTTPRPAPAPGVLAAMQANMTEEQREAMERRREAMAAEPVPVDVQVVGGERLRVLGGLEFLHTPGHTPGHLSLLLPALSLLIAGDALRYANGKVTGAPEHFSADTEQALASARGLAALDFDHMLPYHGEYLAVDASAITRRDIG